MEKEHFRSLLTDLYTYYNPDFLPNVEEKLTHDNGQELDSIRVLFYKYNYQRNPLFNKNYGTEKHIKLLIQQYSNGERTFTGNVQKPIEQQDVVSPSIATQENIEKIDTQQTKEELLSISEKLKDDIKAAVLSDLKSVIDIANQSFEGRRDELNNLFALNTEKFNKYVEQTINETINHVQKLSGDTLTSFVMPIPTAITSSPSLIENNNQKIQLKFNFNNTETDLQIPKEVNDMAVGSRFLVRDANKKMICLEIKDIMYDFVSMPDTFIKEIIIDKAMPE